MKNGIVARGFITDFANRIAHDFVEIELRRRRDFAGEHDIVVFHKRFARDAGTRILRETRVENAIRDEVGDFVRVPGADGFRGKNVAVLAVCFCIHKKKF